MMKPELFRKQAELCRGMAKQQAFTAQQRDDILKMAQTWEAIAREREHTMPLQPPSYLNDDCFA
jgi:hypothetical protein